MNMQSKQFGRQPSGQLAHGEGRPVPGWAHGLRQVYRGVAEEPVPADIAHLLTRLARTA